MARIYIQEKSYSLIYYIKAQFTIHTSERKEDFFVLKTVNVPLNELL